MQQKDAVSVHTSEYDRQREVLFGKVPPSVGVSAHGGIDFPGDSDITRLAQSYHRNRNIKELRNIRGER